MFLDKAMGNGKEKQEWRCTYISHTDWIMRTAVFLSLLGYSAGFSPQMKNHRLKTRLSALDKKEAVKLFGRLAEKYIMLDDTAGKCCYSACSDCEYRLPGGGYRMADQSAARPKWIPSYTDRAANGNQHSTKWSTEIFSEGPAVDKEAFVERVASLEYAPPLGGPYVGASAATIEDASAVEHLFDLLVAEGKDVLTKHRMSLRLQELADGEQGLNWSKFQTAIGA